MLKVYKECCKNCLLSEDRIVSAKAAKQYVQDCTKKQTHFICHKASMKGEETVCSKFFHSFGYVSQMVRIAERLKMIEYVDQEDSEKLPTWKEMNRRKQPRDSD